MGELRKIDMMHILFGKPKESGVTCKTCNHLIKRRYKNTYYKCECFSTKCTPGGDWKVTNPACGLYNKPHKGNLMENIVSRKKAPETEGQLTIS